jgi:hypothetical protein
MRMQNQWLAKAEESNDTVAGLKGRIESGGYPLVMLVGGPEQNTLTRQGIASGWFNETADVEGGYIVKSGKLPAGAVVLAVSDKGGYEAANVKRGGAAYSPLNAIMPREYVPAAATGISLILLVLLNVGRTVFEFKALDIGRKGKRVGEGARMVNGINMTEALAIAGASLVLGTSISWQYFGPAPDFVFWLFVNSLICLFAALLHEVTHRVFAHLFSIRMEYRFWPAGSLLTLISSYLGNAFCIQGFILEEVPPGVAKWKVGLMKLSAPLVSAAVMVAFAALNYLSPDPLYKMIYTTSGLWAMAEILPFGSLDGKDIQEWSHTVWFIAFALIGAAYIFVTFLL